MDMGKGRDGEKRGLFVVIQKAFTRMMTTKWVQFRTPYNKHSSMLMAISPNNRLNTQALNNKVSWTQEKLRHDSREGKFVAMSYTLRKMP